MSEFDSSKIEYIIGIMSGTSLDGLDIAACSFAVILRYGNIPLLQQKPLFTMLNGGIGLQGLRIYHHLSLFNCTMSLEAMLAKVSPISAKETK